MDKLLIIYTGGTIGMTLDPHGNGLIPLDFENLEKQIPEIYRVAAELTIQSFPIPIDSSEMHPRHWVKLALTIQNAYSSYDGFVILHGSDTMAYTASALSFMLENLAKPVILTGSQLPINTPRTDGKENLITALELALEKNPEGLPMVPEVSIYFDSKLLRGNRSVKQSSEEFTAFDSPNFPSLAKAGVNFRFRPEIIIPASDRPLCVHSTYSTDVGFLRLYPGMPEFFWEAAISAPEMKGLVIESFGSGNSTNDVRFLRKIQELEEKGVLIVNISQCPSGGVTMGKYASGKGLLNAGVLSGSDMTSEAAITKLMITLGRPESLEMKKRYLLSSVAGEMTLSYLP